MYPYSIFLVFAAVAVVSHAFVLWRIRALRQTGQYPKKGQETVAAARELLARGKRSLAVRCYRAATGAGLKDAIASVDAMQIAGAPGDR